MSAWYLFSAMGLYPIVGSDRYILGVPLFPRLEIAVPGGVFVIEAPELSQENRYATAVTLDGKLLTSSEVRHQELRAGSVLHFTMSASAH